MSEEESVSQTKQYTPACYYKKGPITGVVLLELLDGRAVDIHGCIHPYVVNAQGVEGPRERQEAYRQPSIAQERTREELTRTRQDKHDPFKMNSHDCLVWTARAEAVLSVKESQK